jgi:hypothetical protein
VLSPQIKSGCPALLAFVAFVARGRGVLANIAAVGHRIHAELLTTTLCPSSLFWDNENRY